MFTRIVFSCHERGSRRLEITVEINKREKRGEKKAKDIERA